MSGSGRLRTIASHMVALALLLPALPVMAHENDQSFELVFVQDPLATTFRDTFGDARSGGRSHHGTDLFAPKMTPVFAAADGVVTIMRWGELAGDWIAIEHLDGWETWYMHLNDDVPATDGRWGSENFTFAPGLAEGSVVLAGDLIAWVGDSGNAEGSSPHTHFELHHDGRVVNPFPFLADSYDRALAAIPIEFYLLAESPELLSVVE